MPDNDFEKQVREKMGELRIAPSETVWEQVDKRLQGKGSRRRRIIWFLFLVTGLASGGYLVLTGGRSGMVRQLSTINRNTNTTLPPVTKRTTLADRTATTKNDKIIPSKDSLKIADEAAVQKNRIESIASNQNTYDARPPKASRNNTPLPAASGSPVTRQLFPREKISKELPAADRQPLPKQQLIAGQDAVRHDLNQLITQADDEIQPGMDAGYPLEPAVVNGTPLTDAISFSFPVNGKFPPIPLAGKLHNHKKNWQWGLTFNAGRSSVTSGSFSNLLGGNAFDYSSANLPAGNANMQGAASFPQPYPTRASTGFSVGTFMKKNLTERFSFSFGVNYTLLSTTNQVGKRTDSLFQQNTAGSQRSFSQYFRVANTGTYTNRYHYIELPVMLQARLTAKGRLPVYWDAGFSLSRMIESNALHYDNTARLYYINNDLLNKTQFNVITGFPVGLSARRKLQLQAGPQVQYGISQRLTNPANTGSHFLFLGLKASLQFDRN